MQNSKSYATALLMKQYKGSLLQLNTNPDSQFSVGLTDENIFKWEVCFEGPPNTLYEGGIFRATLTFPDNFPEQPPVMKFKTQMWHPNIYPDGTVCISILHPPGEDEFNKQESASERYVSSGKKLKFTRWRPVLGIEQILISVLSMLNAPNIESPANVDAGVKLIRKYSKANRYNFEIIQRLTKRKSELLRKNLQKICERLERLPQNQQQKILISVWMCDSFVIDFLYQHLIYLNIDYFFDKQNLRLRN